jgi:regulator of protease activity HflC (stomatin/prohibitin superfamily)
MKLSPRRAETVSLIAFFLHIALFALLLFVLGKDGISASQAVNVGAWHFLGGSLIWFTLLLQFRQRRLAQEEKLEADQYQRLRHEGKDTSVFETGTIESSLHLSQRRLDWLEKYLVPIFSVLVALYLIGVGTWQWLAITDSQPVLGMKKDLLASAASLAGIFFFNFVFARYTIGMSQQGEWRPLRAGGSYMLSNALVTGTLAVILVIANAGYPNVERVANYVLAIALLAVGIEMILNLVLDAYRPRFKGQYHRAPYESRILGLFAEPGGIFRTAAHAIDYQFGFKISESWGYQLLEKAIIPLVLVQALVLYLMSCIAIVPTGHQAVVERWGKPLNIADPWQAGLHGKLPWPIDTVRTFPTEQIQSLDVGFVRNDPDPEKLKKYEHDYKPILWTTEHWKEEFPFLVALQSKSVIQNDEKEAQTNESSKIFDLLIIGLNVQYRIGDVAQFGYGKDRCYLDATEYLEVICNRETMQFAARNDMNTLLGSGQREAARQLHRSIQERVDDKQLGIDIVYVAMEAIHPPIKVAPEFEKVVAALQEKQAKVHSALGEQQGILAMVKGETDGLIATAKADAFEKSALARADAERYQQQVTAFQEGGQIYLWREYLSVLDDYLPDLRKKLIVTSSVENWVHELDLTDTVEASLFEGLGIDQPVQEN